MNENMLVKKNISFNSDNCNGEVQGNHDSGLMSSEQELIFFIVIDWTNHHSIIQLNEVDSDISW